MSDNVLDVFKELNYPSVGILKNVLKTRGIQFTNIDVEELVKREQVRQIQAPKYKFTGKIAASNLNARLFADLIDFTAAPTDGGKKVGLEPTDDNEKYILVVQRVFDRKLWTVALTNKRPETIVEAFKSIFRSIFQTRFKRLRRVGDKVGSITTDLGSEFGESFQRLMREAGIEVHTKQKHDYRYLCKAHVGSQRS